MGFDWKEFLTSNKTVVHCSTEDQAKDFCKKMHEVGLTWCNGDSFLDKTEWSQYKENTCYFSDGCFERLPYAIESNHKIVEWSDYMVKEEKMEENKMFENEQDNYLDLGKLTEEQSNTLLTMFKGFEEENLKFQSRLDNDFLALRNSETSHMLKADEVPLGIAENCFDLGLSASTEEEALRLYKYLLVRKELLEWVEKCPEKVDYSSYAQSKYELVCDYEEETISLNLVNHCTHSDIIFTDPNIEYQAIESIGEERLMRDYFGLGIKSI